MQRLWFRRELTNTDSQLSVINESWMPCCGSECVREPRLWVRAGTQLPSGLSAADPVRSWFNPACSPRRCPGLRRLLARSVDHLQPASRRHRTCRHYRSVPCFTVICSSVHMLVIIMLVCPVMCCVCPVPYSNTFFSWQLNISNKTNFCSAALSR